MAAASEVRIDVDSTLLASDPQLVAAAAALRAARQRAAPGAVAMRGGGPGEEGGGMGPGSGEHGAGAGGADAGGAGRGDVDGLGWMLTGGEDHALAATFPAGTQLPARWSVIGAITVGRGVRVDGESSRAHSGWNHFR